MENQTTNDKLLSLFEDYKKLNARYEETNYNTVAIRERKVLSEKEKSKKAEFEDKIAKSKEHMALLKTL